LHSPGYYLEKKRWLKDGYVQSILNLQESVWNVTQMEVVLAVGTVESGINIFLCKH
jgi:hypothetical protein